MEFDFAEVLLQVMERNASDLHLTAGSPPMIRQRPAARAGLPAPDAADHA